MKISKPILGVLLVTMFASPAFAHGWEGSGNHGKSSFRDGAFNGPGGLFDQIDTNKDGVITRAEVKAAHDAMFIAIDTNRDGFLTREEMAAHRKAQMEKMQQRMATAPNSMFQLIDKNKDGIVTQDEWNAFTPPSRPDMSKKPEMTQRHKDFFKKLDANNDGKITAAEFAAGRPNHKMIGRKEMMKMGGGHMGKGGPRNPDTNNDGKISKAEWDAMPFPLFDVADINKDGKITKEEAASASKNKLGRDFKAPRD